MKTLILYFIFFFNFYFAWSQKTNFTLFAGSANYNGDLQPKQYTLKHAHPALGIGLEYELTAQLYITTGIKFSKLSGEDSTTINYKRNLNFSTNITELQGSLTYDIINLQEHNFTPYVFAGIAIFHFNPYTKSLTGQKVYLQPLGTEGQGFFPGRKKYALTQISIPFGIGLKYTISNNLRIGLELSFRKTFTDYIDDVSTYYVDKNALLAHNGPVAVTYAFRGDDLANRTYPKEGKKRGNPTLNDVYYFTGLTFCFRIGKRTNEYYETKYQKRF